MKFRGWIQSRANVVFMGGLLFAAPPQRCTPEGGGGSGGASGAGQAGEASGGSGGASISGSSGSGGVASGAGGAAGESSQAGASESEAGSPAGNAGSASGGGGSGGSSEGGGSEAGGAETAGSGGSSAGSGTAGAAGSGPAQCGAGSFEMVGQPGCFECPGYIYDSDFTCAMLATDSSQHYYDSVTHKVYLRAGDNMPRPQGWGITLDAGVMFGPDFDAWTCPAWTPTFSIEGDYYVADFSAYFACTNDIDFLYLDYLWPDYGCATYIEDYSQVGVMLDEAGQGTMIRHCVVGEEEPPIAFGSLTPLPRPARYDASNPLAVKDLATGLYWEQRSSGFYGYRTQADAVTWCEDLNYAGFTDWRLPTAKELISLVRFDLGGNHLDPVALPFAGAGQFWSSSTLPLDPESGRFVNFGPYASYDVDPYYSSPFASDYWEYEHSSRCVRGGNAEPPVTYTNHGNGTVTDNRSGLVWEKAPTQGGLIPSEAQAYCRDLALAGGGWRVPTLQELVGLTFDADGMPALDPVFQSHLPASTIQWSSTIFAEADFSMVNAAGWLVQNDGSLRPESDFGWFTPGDVRCVR